MRVIGIDLAWREGSTIREANESGVVAVDPAGEIVDAGWTRGLDETVAWLSDRATGETLLTVDAPLVVENEVGQRMCERQVGRQYGSWKVSANSTNRRSARLGGVSLLRMLEAAGWRYDDGCGGPPAGGRRVVEVYPYVTLVGAAELGYGQERPRYKRKPPTMTVGDFRPRRASTCDELVARIAQLKDADPPIDISSHPVTHSLALEPSPIGDTAYKHREDLIDAVLSAWTGLVWMKHGLERCQVLGCGDAGPRQATIIAPCDREGQRAKAAP